MPAYFDKVSHIRRSYEDVRFDCQTSVFLVVCVVYGNILGWWMNWVEALLGEDVFHQTTQPVTSRSSSVEKNIARLNVISIANNLKSFKNI